MVKAILKVEHLGKRFQGVIALDDFSMEVKQREILGLTGPNGAGKTTLFNVLSGFLEADSGKALFNGHAIMGMPAHRITKLGLARTFQIVRLAGQLPVLDNVLLWFKDQPGENLLNVFFKPKKTASTEKQYRDKATLLLEEFGLLDKLNDPAEALSYGQQKLLSIACCLASDTKLLLLDEPVSGVALKMIPLILNSIKMLSAKGVSVILIEHNIEAIVQVCERVIFMDAGKLVFDGPPETMIKNASIVEAYLD